MNNTECPGCSGPIVNVDSNNVGECGFCGGLVSTKAITREVAKQFVNLDVMNPEQSDPADWVYFDLDIIDTDSPNGFDRVHGWFDPSTKMVEQFG